MELNKLNNILKWGIVLVVIFVVYIGGHILGKLYASSVGVPDYPDFSVVWGMGAVTGATMVSVAERLREILWPEESSQQGGGAR